MGQMGKVLFSRNHVVNAQSFWGRAGPSFKLEDPHGPCGDLRWSVQLNGLAGRDVGTAGEAGGAFTKTAEVDPGRFGTIIHGTKDGLVIVVSKINIQPAAWRILHQFA